MKCRECGTDTERSITWPSVNNPGRESDPGWVVYYCPNKRACSLASHTVPQVPRRKPKDMIEVNSAKPSLMKAAREAEAKAKS